MKAKSYISLAAFVVCAALNNLQAQTLIPENELDETRLYSLEEAAFVDADSVFGFAYANFDEGGPEDSASFISEEIFKFRNLQVLILNSCMAAHILDKIDRFPYLQSLTIANIGVDSIPQAFYNLKHLKLLSLSQFRDLNFDQNKLIGNNIHRLLLSDCEARCVKEEDCGFPYQAFPELTELFPGSDNGEYLSRIFELRKLKSLDLSSENFPEIPAGISKLINLEELLLSNNSNLEILPEEIGDLTKLKILNISGTSITVLPQSIGNLTNLGIFIAETTPLTELPETFGNLRRLKTLNVSSSNISALPVSFGKLDSLENLYLYSTYLGFVPEPILKLVNLQILDLSSCGITTIPSDFQNLKSMYTLYLDYNPIQTIAQGAFNLPSLITLYMSNCNFKKIPDEIGNLTNLGWLALANDSILEWNNALNKLSNLRSLDLSSNQLKSISEGISGLSSLTDINLSDNQLQSLPKNIIKLQSLYSLMFSGNKVAALPKGISKMTGLLYITAIGNKGIKFPKEIKKMVWLESIRLGKDDLKPNELAALIKLMGEEKVSISEY